MRMKRKEGGGENESGSHHVMKNRRKGKDGKGRRMKMNTMLEI